MQEENGEQQQQSEYRKEMAKRVRALQIEQQKRELMKRFMTTEAYERLMNVRISSSELYSQLVDIILTMVQSKRIAGKITEPQLREILSRLTYRPESKIEFRHK